MVRQIKKNRATTNANTPASRSPQRTTRALPKRKASTGAAAAKRPRKAIAASNGHEATGHNGHVVAEQNGRVSVSRTSRAPSERNGISTPKHMANQTANGSVARAATKRISHNGKGRASQETPTDARPAKLQRNHERALASARADRALVDRCLNGDKASWTKIYNQFHSSLLLAIRILLGRNAVRQDLVDEIAAKVWFAVVDREGQLLARFDSERACRLSTFLAGLARNEISRYFRSERRRNIRETQVCRHRERIASDSHWESVFGLGTAVKEFLATLTPSERDYCEEHLLAVNDSPPKDYSDANRWQLNHRVRVKLCAFVTSQ
jgi:DNA-directed RNA polymerase specialized sigma24 family protein